MPFSREADRAALSHSPSFGHRLHWVRYAQNTRKRACQRHDAAGISLRPHRTVGRNFDSEFRPELTPKQMLALGIFCGKYMTDCRKEFPASWFANARLSSCRDCSLNYFGVDASQPLSVWRKNGWIHPDDPRGGFQWFVDTTWGGAYRAKTRGKLSAGKRSDDTSRRLGGIASPAIPL